MNIQSAERNKEMKKPEIHEKKHPVPLSSFQVRLAAGQEHKNNLQIKSGETV